MDEDGEVGPLRSSHDRRTLPGFAAARIDKQHGPSLNLKPHRLRGAEEDLDLEEPAGRSMKAGTIRALVPRKQDR